MKAEFFRCARVLVTVLLMQLWSSAQAQMPDSSLLAEALPDNWRQFRQREPVFGSDLFWVEVGEQSKPSVLLVHGLGAGGLRSLTPVIEGLSGRYHVVALDLPGFGLSGMPSGRYSPTNYARVLNWFTNELDLGPTAVLGHSMGAAVALRFAADYPRAVERLILVNAAGILQRTAFIQHVASVPLDLGEQSQGIAAAADTLRTVGRFLVEWSNFLPDTGAVLDTNSWVWKTFVDGQPSVNAALSLVDEDFSSAIADVNTDTYIIVGTSDPLAPPRTGRLLAGSLRHAQLFEMLGSDHIPMYSEPELFMTLLEQALQANGVSEPYWRRPKRVYWGAKDLICDGEDGQRYSGYYKRIELRKCAGVLLENVSAQSVSLIDSSAQIYNLEVRAEPPVAISLERSDLQLTNAKLKAAIGITSSASRVDVAGLQMQVGESAVVGIGENRFIVSVSDLRSPGYQGYVHGSFRLDDASLEAQLR